MRAAGPGCGLAEQVSPRAQLGWAESGRGLLHWPQPVKHSASFHFLFFIFFRSIYIIVLPSYQSLINCTNVFIT
jgi:hypothetical protein